MSDLIININFDESKKKNGIVVETYEGTIPKLKSKKYSGQLRNVNINANKIYDNLSALDIQIVREFLNKSVNIQINKFQYILSRDSLLEVGQLIKLECMFYRDKKNGMFQIEEIDYNSIVGKNIYSIGDIQYSGEKTKICFVFDIDTQSCTVQEIVPKAYIDLTNKTFNLELKFDYGNLIVDFLDRNRMLESEFEYRNYGFEEKTQKLIEQSGWNLKKTSGFVFAGRDLNDSIKQLIDSGIDVYTNNEKKITSADFSNIRVSYNLDWFSIEGKVSYDNILVDIQELINFRKKKQSWVEYNGKIILIPAALGSKNIFIDQDSGEILLDKKYISSAIGIAHDINDSVVRNLDELTNYNKISYNIDSSISKILRDYQLTGVKWLLSLRKNGFGACLADDMGLGKTLQIIAYLSDTSMNNTQSLIIVPKTLLLNWAREFSKFSPQTKIYVYHGPDRSKEKMKNVKIVISTYQTLVNDLAVFSNIKFENLIVDEAQYIKNSRSKAYNAIKNIKTTMKILLTGTPIENNLAEFWGLMRLINPDIIESYSSIPKKQDQLVSRIRILSEPFLLRRLKRDVLKELPKKQEQTLFVKMDEEQQKLYDKMLESIRYEILRKNDRFEMKSNSIMLNGLLYLQEICCHPQLLGKEYNNECTESAKMELLLELLDDLYSNGHKIVVFSRFTKMLSIIEKKIAYSHMNFYYLDGGTKNRMELVDEFERSNNGIFLISLKAGGTGINLTSADTAIIYDPWWNPASERQAEDRIYRIGQKKNVMIYRLIAEGTIEEKIQKLQKEKIKLCSDILDGHEIPIAMTAEIMEQLLLS